MNVDPSQFLNHFALLSDQKHGNKVNDPPALDVRIVMHELNNLNLITRLELLDTLKVLPSGCVPGRQIAALLNGVPSEKASRSENDIFDIQFDRGTLEAIAYSVEQYAYDLAEPYVVTVEEGTNETSDDRSFQYWQVLSERWSYLELMR